MAGDKELRFYGIKPHNLFTWNDFWGPLLFGLSEARGEVDIELLQLQLKLPRTTEISLTGRAENHVLKNSYQNGVLSLKIYDYDDMLKLRRWYELGSMGHADIDYDLLGYPTTFAPTSIVWLKWVDDDMEEMGLDVAGLEGDNKLICDYGSTVSDELPWVLIDRDPTIAPRRHYFTILDQTLPGLRLNLSISPPLVRRFEANSLLHPLYQFEPGIVTNGVFDEEMDDDMLTWRFTCNYRSVSTNWREQFITPV